MIIQKTSTSRATKVSPYLVFLLLSILLGILLLPAAVVRADVGVSVSAPGSAEIGSTITVNISVGGSGPYSGFNGAISYDSSLLELQSLTSGDYSAKNFTANGNSFLEYNANIPGGVIVTATFSCLKAGAANISASLDDIADMDGNSIAASGGSATVTINASTPKSSNANLSGLAVSPGSLSPAFSSSTQSYSVTVNQSQITVSATPEDGKASVALNGVQDNLSVGSNQVAVTVTAEDGTTKVYTLTVTRTGGTTTAPTETSTLTPTPTSTPTALPTITIANKQFTIVTAGEGDNIPQGFTPATAKYQGQDIPVLRAPLTDAENAPVITICLLESAGVRSFFVYDEATESFYPYIVISTSALNFQVVGGMPTTGIPKGYEAFEYTYQDTPITAYRLTSNPDNVQILLYLMNEKGEIGFYFYDTESQMIMPYRGDTVLVVPTTTPTPIIAPTVSPTPVPVAQSLSIMDTLKDFTNPVAILIYVIGLICLLLIIAVIILIIRRHQKPKGGDNKLPPDDHPNPPAGGMPTEGKDLHFGDPVPVSQNSSSPVATYEAESTYTENWLDQSQVVFGDSNKPEPLYFGDPIVDPETKLDFPPITPANGSVVAVSMFEEVPLEPENTAEIGATEMATSNLQAIFTPPESRNNSPAQPVVQRVNTHGNKQQPKEYVGNSPSTSARSVEPIQKMPETQGVTPAQKLEEDPDFDPDDE